MAEEERASEREEICIRSLNEYQTNNPSKGPFRFLDLPPEIRNRIYHFVLPVYPYFMYDPQMFKTTFPRLVAINFGCSSRTKELRLVMKLTQQNQQIRDEVNSIIYGRHGSEGVHCFRTVRYRLWRPYGRSAPVCKLDRTRRYAARLLGAAGIPFAVLRTKTWFSWIGWYEYELLVPDWSSRGVTWRKMREVQDQGQRVEDEVLLSVRRRSEGKGWKGLKNW